MLKRNIILINLLLLSSHVSASDSFVILVDGNYTENESTEEIPVQEAETGVIIEETVSKEKGYQYKKIFTIAENSTATKIEVKTIGGTGDLMLYAGSGDSVHATQQSSYDCSSDNDLDGIYTHEICVLDNVKPGLYSLSLFAHYESFYNVDLTVTLID